MDKGLVREWNDSVDLPFQVLPMLKSYVRRRSELAKTKAVDVNFFVPDYIYGEYSSETGDGVIVFEDYRLVQQGYNRD